jgi:hypothetical protein
MASMTFEWTNGDLEQFRKVQRLAYDAVTDVERRLSAGMTEKQVAGLMDAYLRERGVVEYFHKPFVWFGDRTAFVDFRTDLAFFPTNARLSWGMPVILDVAPTLEGYAADIGYSCCFGENALLARMQRDLYDYRTLLLEGVRKERTLRDIYRELDRAIESHGYVNRHRRYPNSVLAHTVTRLEPGLLGRLTIGGFGLRALRFFDREMRAFKQGAIAHGPFWNGEASSDRRATPGIWAVEPHIGCEGVGAKWEELLVVTDSDAYWLDDDLPHHRHAARARTKPVAEA